MHNARLEQARQLRNTGTVEARRQAQAICETLLRTEPALAEALHLSALLQYESGQPEPALETMQAAALAAPGNAAIQTDLGGLLNVAGRLDDAIACFQRSLELAPDEATTHYNLGCTLQARGILDGAEASYRKAHALAPDNAEILCNLGGCLQEQGRPDDAIAYIRLALEKQPGDIKSLNNLGVALQANGKLAEAKVCYETTLSSHPDSVRTHVNLGLAYYESGDYEKAVACHRKALELDAQYPEAHFCLGVALHALCLHEQAIACYRRAIAVKPDYSNAYDNLLMTMLFIDGVTPEGLFEAHRQFGELFEAKLRPHWPRLENARDPQRRLKVGYVSGDFRQHAVAYFFEPILANHDREQFEVFCYSNSRRFDFVTQRLMQQADHWRNCLSMSDEQLARQIREDGIDILVDLSGHSAYNRLLTFARKPAPVQMTYLGYPGGTGLTAMDYRLTDSFTEPAGSEKHYVETLLRLPDSIWCYRPTEDMTELTPLPALANGYLTFGSFNNINKVGEDCLVLWAHLLRNVPDSRLLLVTVPEGEVRERLLRRFAELGVAPERIRFKGKLPPGEFRRLLPEVDITLDPFPTNGATTTCESLWQGVPTLSIVGNRFLSRAGLSVLNAARMPDFAAASVEEYVNLAVLLSKNLSLLADIRNGLRDHLRMTPLFDEGLFTRNLEKLYRDAWKTWCEKSKERGKSA